jgi:2-dehydro-3-deoxyphosphogluconate aldolase/(4S)-4-hydroxy-2-oxoglutarate aldolase
MDIAAITGLAPAIPVLTIDRVADAVPLARALVKGGLPVLEIALRTPAAVEAVKSIVAAVPDAIVGAGTILNERHLGEAREAGARFGVSPGCTDALAAAIKTAGMPFLPGVQTVSEALTLGEQGFRLLKFFPAGSAGGLGWLKAVGPPLAGVKFCPTGGISQENAAAYLALPNVTCVGGSWVAPGAMVAAGRWLEIEQLARAAATLKRGSAHP